MAPEQALGRSDEVDGLTDVWAVGATMFALASGGPVHEASTPQEQMVFSATRSARSLAAVVPEAPAAATTIVDRALSFHRSERWPSAAAMRDAVRDAYRAECGEDPSPAALVFMASPEKMPVSERSPPAAAPSPMASTVPETPVSLEPRQLADPLGRRSPTSLAATASHARAPATGRVRVVAGAAVLVAAGVLVGAWGATRGHTAASAPTAATTSFSAVPTSVPATATIAPLEPGPQPAPPTPQAAAPVATSLATPGRLKPLRLSPSASASAPAPAAASIRSVRPPMRHAASRVAACALSLGLASAIASPAAAGDEVDQAAATELFNAGRDMMKRGEYGAACPKLAESVRLQPTVGALAKLGECEEHEHRLVTAYARWQQALNLARGTGDERVGDVERELARLDAIVPKVRVVAQGPLPEGTTIRVDAVELGPAGVGVPLPVEAGPHSVQASEPRKVTWSTTVQTAADGATTTVTIPVLEDAPAPAPPPTPAPPAPPLAAPAPAAPPSPWPAVGLAAAGVGLASVAVGSVLGVEAMHQRDEAGCPGNVCPGYDAADTLRSAKSAANWSTALFIAGGALVGGGISVWWLTRDHGSSAAAVLFTPGGAVGRF